MTETFYDVLGVDPGATTSDIEDAYRERIKETHPDLNDDEDADEATQRVIEARNVLSDEEERERYDRLGHAAYVGDADGGTTETDADESGGSASRAARRRWRAYGCWAAPRRRRGSRSRPHSRQW